MKTTVTKQVTVTLVLTEAEAKWLNSAMQNPIHAKSLVEEFDDDAEMRSLFFNATLVS